MQLLWHVQDGALHEVLGQSKNQHDKKIFYYIKQTRCTYFYKNVLEYVNYLFNIGYIYRN